jgi:hypothetical protein
MTVLAKKPKSPDARFSVIFLRGSVSRFPSTMAYSNRPSMEAAIDKIELGIICTASPALGLKIRTFFM